MMKLHPCICLLLSLSFVKMKVLNISGRVGNDLSFTCSNWSIKWDATEYAKYICKSPCKEDKHIINRAVYKRIRIKNQIILTNSGNHLHVTFINLQKSDAGKYYCGIELFGWDTLIEVNVKVLDVKSRPEKTPETVSVTEISSTADLSGVTKNMSTSCTTVTASSTGRAGHALYWILSFAVVIALMVITLLLTRLVIKKLAADTAQPEPAGKAGDQDGVYQNLNPTTMDGQMVYEV